MSQNAVSYETLFEFGENAEQNSITQLIHVLKTFYLLIMQE